MLRYELGAQEANGFGAQTTKQDPGQAVDKWTVRAALETPRWPWTTLRVAHRAGLCPLAHRLPPPS